MSTLNVVSTGAELHQNGVPCSCKKADSTHKSHNAYTLHWSFTNSKLAKDRIISFNLPAFRSASGQVVCHSASVCALLCYARQGRYIMPNVQQPREHNLEYLNTHTSAEFIHDAVNDLCRLHPSWRMVRMHDSGDFLSDAYFLAWCEIARQCRHLKFYAYTKRISMVTALRHLMPDNMHVIQSVGGLEDSLIDTAYPHAVIFQNEDALEAAGYTNGTKSEYPAYSGCITIGLVYHGSNTHKRLTAHEQATLERRNDAVLTTTPVVNG